MAISKRRQALLKAASTKIKELPPADQITALLSGSDKDIKDLAKVEKDLDKAARAALEIWAEKGRTGNAVRAYQNFLEDRYGPPKSEEEAEERLEEAREHVEKVKLLDRRAKGYKEKETEVEKKARLAEEKEARALRLKAKERALEQAYIDDLRWKSIPTPEERIKLAKEARERFKEMGSEYKSRAEEVEAASERSKENRTERIQLASVLPLNEKVELFEDGKLGRLEFLESLTAEERLELSQEGKEAQIRALAESKIAPVEKRASDVAEEFAATQKAKRIAEHRKAIKELDAELHATNAYVETLKSGIARGVEELEGMSIDGPYAEARAVELRDNISRMRNSLQEAEIKLPPGPDVRFSRYSRTTLLDKLANHQRRLDELLSEDKVDDSSQEIDLGPRNDAERKALAIERRAYLAADEIGRNVMMNEALAEGKQPPVPFPEPDPDLSSVARLHRLPRPEKPMMLSTGVIMELDGDTIMYVRPELDDLGLSAALASLTPQELEQYYNDLTRSRRKWRKPEIDYNKIRVSRRAAARKESFAEEKQGYDEQKVEKDRKLLQDLAIAKIHYERGLSKNIPFGLGSIEALNKRLAEVEEAINAYQVQYGMETRNTGPLVRIGRKHDRRLDPSTLVDEDDPEGDFDPLFIEGIDPVEELTGQTGVTHIREVVEPPSPHVGDLVKGLSGLREVAQANMEYYEGQRHRAERGLPIYDTSDYTFVPATIDNEQDVEDLAQLMGTSVEDATIEAAQFEATRVANETAICAGKPASRKDMKRLEAQEMEWRNLRDQLDKWIGEHGSAVERAPTLRSDAADLALTDPIRDTARDRARGLEYSQLHAARQAAETAKDLIRNSVRSIVREEHGDSEVADEIIKDTDRILSHQRPDAAALLDFLTHLEDYDILSPKSVHRARVEVDRMPDIINVLDRIDAVHIGPTMTTTEARNVRDSLPDPEMLALMRTKVNKKGRASKLRPRK